MGLAAFTVYSSLQPVGWFSRVAVCSKVTAARENRGELSGQRRSIM